MSGRLLTRVPFRERAKQASGALIEVASPLLKDVIDYADSIFWLCLEAAERPDLEDHAPLVLYRHIIEMSDGIEALISEGCAGPAWPLLRSCFEVLYRFRQVKEKKVLVVDFSHVGFFGV